MSGPKRSNKITDHFTCTSANVICCITCTYCKKLYIGETGRRLGDRFREQLRDLERNDKDVSKPVVRHFNLPNHSTEHMAVSDLSLARFRQFGKPQNSRTKIHLNSLLILTVSTSPFHSIILVFSSPYSHQ